LARQLGVDEDLTETLALAHDLGHPPFGHAGERALDACLESYGGFDHNAQALRVVTQLEHRYPKFDGLNLTWESLEGIVKHNGPLTDHQGQPIGHYRERGIPTEITKYNAAHDLELGSFASLEAQIAAIADDIAYNAHDIDDGLRAGLFFIDDLKTIPLTAEIIAQIDLLYPGLDQSRRGAELVRELIAYLIEAVLSETTQRLQNARLGSVNAIRSHHEPLVALSNDAAAAEKLIKSFLYQRMYRHPRVTRIMGDAEDIVCELFARYWQTPKDLPSGWASWNGEAGEVDRARKIVDFIAGMTDRFAITEHMRLFDSTPDLR
jgi:dGTPase